MKLTVAPDAHEPLTLSPEIDTAMRPPRSALNVVEPPPIEATASSQIFLKFEPVDGGTPVPAVIPKTGSSLSLPTEVAAGDVRSTILPKTSAVVVSVLDRWGSTAFVMIEGTDTLGSVTLLAAETMGGGPFAAAVTALTGSDVED